MERALAAAKDEISRHAIGLEQVVEERTNELRETVVIGAVFLQRVPRHASPLARDAGYSEFLLEQYAGKLDEQGVDYLQQIVRGSVRLDRLILDVLSYTRVLHANLPMQAVDLHRLVREMVEALPRGQFGPPDIHIRGALPTVMGNPALLGQCISNLMSNGTKFVAQGKTPRVEIFMATTKDGAFRLCFQDNGIGISPENHGRIFGLFERLHTEKEYEGTGMGLTIVRKAAERMGGRAGFESKLGKGSKFWIQFKKE